MFEQDADARQVASSLRISTKSVYQWRRAWQVGGKAALASKGVGGDPCKLDEARLAQLEAGLVAYGWAQDQRWTLARVAALVPPGSGCPQLRLPAATGTAAAVSHLRSNRQRLTAHRSGRPGRPGWLTSPTPPSTPPGAAATRGHS
jgi:transposase-like protein